MADYNSDRTGSNIDLTLDKVDALDAKVQPTVTGVDVTGTITADGLTVDGASDQVVINGTNSAGATLVFLKDGGSNGSGVIHYNSTHATLSDELWIKNYTLTGDIHFAPKNQKALTIDGATGDVSFYEDTGTTAKMVWDASAESLGIGTASPSQLLDVSSASNPAFHITNTDGTNGSTLRMVMATNGAFIGLANPQGGSDVLRFGTGNEQERARIDSSGNLLVGKTSSNIAISGVELTPNDRSAFTRANGNPILANRTGSDGEIINLRKDGSTVGSIGVYDGRPYLASTTVGIRVSNALFPCDTSGAVTDNQCDIGGTVGGFRNLYLSGGVYLGGTGAANKLDDYEEGNWTPVVGVNNFSVSPTVLTGNYTKVGRLVTVRLSMNFPSSTTMPNYSTVSGLPFTTTGQGGAIAATDTVFSHARVAASGSNLFFTYLEGTASLIDLVLTYQTND